MTRARRIRLSGFIAIAFVAGLAACGGGGSGGGTPGTPAPLGSEPAGPDIIPPSGQIYLGAYVSTIVTPTPPTTEIQAFEQKVGRTFAMTQHYYGFFDDFPGPDEAADVAAGRLSVESWSCQYPNSAIVAGNEDDAIRRRADAFKAFGKPIFLRYMWEMNLASTPKFRAICYDKNTDEPNGVFSPSEYIGAWDRIRSIFAAEGATNVVWLWNPSGAIDPLPYYPGNGEVDWIGIDKYDDSSVSFAQTYGRPYGWLARLGKPIMIGETGAAGSIQPSFFGLAVSTLQTEFPDIKAYIYFDSAGFLNNWTVGTNGLPSFIAMANDPYFSAVGLPTPQPTGT